MATDKISASKQRRTLDRTQRGQLEQQLTPQQTEKLKAYRKTFQEFVHAQRNPKATAKAVTDLSLKSIKARHAAVNAGVPGELVGYNLTKPAGGLPPTHKSGFDVTRDLSLINGTDSKRPQIQGMPV